MGGDRADAGLVVALLGPVEIGPAGGVMTPVAQPRLRVLLGLLGVAAGRVVSAEALVDGLWGEEWSPGRERNLHVLVYQLRRRLAALEPRAGPRRGGARLARAGTGYRLVVGPGELDVEVFRGLAGRAREAAQAGSAERARELFGQALGLWRGPALADAAPLCPRLAGEAARMEEARLAVVEERIGCDLALGRHGEVAGEVDADLDRATATMRVNNADVEDFHTLKNALLGGPSDPASVSSVIRWQGVKARVEVRDFELGFAGRFIEDSATVEWSASVPSTGFSFRSDPATTSKTVFAEIGSERNGVFFHGAA